MSAAASSLTTIQQKYHSAYEKVGKFLDTHPTVYKAVLVACHLFRAIGMYGMMLALPLPLPASLALMTAGTLVYRAAVERFCCFRFAIPSMAGAGAIWLARAAVISSLAGQAILPLAGLFPLTAYCVWVVFQSHRDIEKRIPSASTQATTCCECA